MSMRTILFGDAVNAPPAAAIARALGRHKSTVSRWKENPAQIQLGDLRQLVRVRKLTDAEILQLFK